MKQWLKSFLLYVLIVICIFMGSLYGFLLSSFGRNLLIEKGKDSLQKAYQIEASLSELSVYGLFPLKLALKDVNLHSINEETWRFFAKDLSLEINLWKSFFKKNLVLNDVFVKDSLLKLQDTSVHQRSFGKEEDFSELFFQKANQFYSLVPKNINFKDFHLIYAESDVTLSLMRLKKNQFFSIHQGFDFYLLLNKQTIAFPRGELSFDKLSLKSNLNLDQKQIKVLTLKGATSQSFFQTKGTFLFLASRQQWLFQLPSRLHFNLDDFESLLKDGFHGTVKGDAFVRGSWGQKVGMQVASQLNIFWEDLELSHFKLHHGKSQGLWTLHQLSLVDLEIFVEPKNVFGVTHKAHPPKVEFSEVEIDFQHETFQAKSNLAGLTLSSLLSSLRVDSNPQQTDFTFSGQNVSYKGRFNQQVGFEIEVLGDLNVVDFYPFGYQADEWDLGLCQFHLDLYSSIHFLKFNETMISCRHGNQTQSFVRLKESHIHYETGDVAFYFDSDHLQSKVLDNLWSEQPLNGRIAVKGSLKNKKAKGPLAAFLNVQSKQLFYHDQPIEKLNLKIHLNASELQVTNLNFIYNHQTRLQVPSLIYDFDEKKLVANYQFQGSLDPFHHKKWTNLFIKGSFPKANGKIVIELIDGQPTLQFWRSQVVSSGLRFQNIWIHQFEADFLYEKKRVSKLNAKVFWREGELLLTRLEKEKKLHFDFKKLSLQEIFIDSMPFQTHFSGSFQTDLNLNWRSLTGSGRFYSNSYRHLRIPDLQLRSRSQMKKSLEFILEDSQSQLMSRLILSQNLSSQSFFFLSFQNFDLMKRVLKVQEDVESSLTGRMLVNFQLSQLFGGKFRLHDLYMKCEMDQFDIQISDQHLGLKEPVKIMLNQNHFAITPLIFVRDQDELTILLSLNDRRFDLNLNGSLTLDSILCKFVPNLSLAQGKILINLKIKDVFEKPELEGPFEIVFLQLGFKNFNPVFKDLSVKGICKNQKLLFHSFTGTKGQGSFAGSGEVNFAPWFEKNQVPQMNLTFSLKNLETQVPNSFFQNMILRLSGQMQLIGDDLPYSLSGQVTIDRFLGLSPYYCEEYINPINPRSYVSVTHSLEDSPDPLIQFDLTCEAKQSIFLKTNCIDSTFSANLSVHGNNQDPLVSGDVLAHQGKIRLFQSNFDIESFNLILDREDIYIAGQLMTIMSPYKIFLDINGTVNAPEINLTSVPDTFPNGSAVTDQDLIDAILTGRMPLGDQRGTSQTVFNVFNTISQSNLVLQRLTKSVTRGLIESLAIRPVFHERSAALQASITQKVTDQLTLGLLFEEGYGYRDVRFQSQLFFNQNLGILGTARFSDHYGVEGFGRYNEIKGSFEFQFGR
jgi:hypothetical protein